ncbi:MAG TPA: hypothetical protein GX691_00225 [Clostridia bacterium]|jgi:hypothetical protein|nr:hypothetical protein [Clostridia bacterium]
MGKVERKLLLAYVNNCRQITSYDKELHKDFFFFNMIMKDEFGSQMNLIFELVNGKKGTVVFENEPFCHDLEMLVFKLVQEGKFSFVEGDRIDITEEGYMELVELRKLVDPIAPSVRYMVTRLGDKKYHERYRQLINKMKQGNKFPC